MQGVDLDAHLSDSQKAEVAAFTALVETTLMPASVSIKYIVIHDL